MKITIITLVLLSTILGCQIEKQQVPKNQKVDREEILKTIDNWSDGWKNKDVELSIKDYAQETDWTNAFGDRVQSKKELKALLERIFNMDFVMAGNSSYVENDIQFIDENIAMLRSKNVRKNQEWSDGSKMEDRHINHLRILKRIDGKWQIISHMISQAHEKK